MKYFFPLLTVFFLGCSDQNSLQITQLNGQYGAQNLDGKIMIKHQYEMMYPFDERGFAKVIGFRGKYGVISSDGRIILDIIYDYIGEFDNGKAKIILNGRDGYIDLNYKVIKKP